MNKKFRFNFEAQTIVGSKRSIEKANKGIEPEYSQLTEMLSKHPSFKVAAKVIKAKNGKNTHEGLTFERMEKFIKLLDNSEEVLKEFEAAKQVGEAKGSKYPTTMKWFLEKFPELKVATTAEEREMYDQKIADMINSLASRAA